MYLFSTFVLVSIIIRVIIFDLSISESLCSTLFLFFRAYFLLFHANFALPYSNFIVNLSFTETKEFVFPCLWHFYFICQKFFPSIFSKLPKLILFFTFIVLQLLTLSSFSDSSKLLIFIFQIV